MTLYFSHEMGGGQHIKPLFVKFDPVSCLKFWWVGRIFWFRPWSYIITGTTHHFEREFLAKKLNSCRRKGKLTNWIVTGTQGRSNLNRGGKVFYSLVERGWLEANILVFRFLPFYALTRQSHSFMMVRSKIKFLNKLWPTNTAGTAAENIRRKLLKTTYNKRQKRNFEQGVVTDSQTYPIHI